MVLLSSRMGDRSVWCQAGLLPWFLCSAKQSTDIYIGKDSRHLVRRKSFDTAGVICLYNVLNYVKREQIAVNRFKAYYTVCFFTK